VETLLVDREAEAAGMRCRDCELLAAAKPQQCPGCGSTSVFHVDLVNELVELAERTSAETEFTDPIPALAELGGVAALLRY
jgi:peptide chain release factor subunit 1